MEQGFLGMVLFCTYARSRWSDAQHSESRIEDRDEFGRLHYIECSTGVHKTARAMQMWHQFLPLVAPVHGLIEEPWREYWLDARKVLDIQSLEQYPLMPVPDVNGVATVRPLNTSECKAWMRLILEKHSCTLMGLETTFSLKATFLSYLAKRGGGLEDRLILGYHTNSLRMA